jgi:uncharacterized protein YjbI with pentapeptide repeats
MKANEVLNQYAAGDRDFSGIRLLGQSFRGQNLSGANFSHSDIRGTDFSGANLHCANFSHCRAGLPPRQRILILISSLLLSSIAGLLIGTAIYGSLLTFISSNSLMHALGDAYSQGAEWGGRITLVLFIAFGLLSIYQKPIVSAVLGGIAALTSVIFVLLGIAGYKEFGSNSWAAAAALVGAFGLQTVGPVAIVTSKAVSNKTGVLLSIASNASVAIATTFLMDRQYHLLDHNRLLLADKILLAAVITSGRILFPIATAILSAAIGHRIFVNKDKRPWLRRIVLSLASTGGTRFQNANLSDADFTKATLPNTNYEGANLTRTLWFHAHQLPLARIEKTYLADSQNQQLVTSGQGQGQNFDYMDLRGVNLQNANLAEASFIGTNLSEATLTGANLVRAKLVRTQLYRADLSNANLTGAYIQDWGISTNTMFDQVKCDYVYMRSPTPDDPDPCRKPDNRNEIFKAGDFENFIAPIIKTLDLYSQQNVDPRNVAKSYKTIDLFHHEGIDPGAAAIALQQLAEQHPEAGIEVIALEGRGPDQIRVQAIVSSRANRSELSAEYSENYRQLKALPHSDLQSLLISVADKDNQIHRLEAMLEQAIQQPRFYVETYRHQGEFVMSQSQGNIRVDHVKGNVSGIAAAGEHLHATGSVLGNISGTVTNTINQLPTIDSDQPNLKELLKQLQAVIESESELNDEDKVEALEQVQVLAEAGKNPDDGALKKAAKIAIKVLKGTAASLPDAAELVKGSQSLLTTISMLLAIA